MKNKDNLKNIIDKLYQYIKESKEENLSVLDERETNVLIYEKNHKGYMYNFSFGKREYPFNLIKGYDKYLHSVYVEIVDKSFKIDKLDTISVQEFSDFISHVNDKVIYKFLFKLLDLIKEDSLLILKPVLSTDRSFLYLKLVNDSYEIKVNLKDIL